MNPSFEKRFIVNTPFRKSTLAIGGFLLRNQRTIEQLEKMSTTSKDERWITSVEKRFLVENVESTTPREMITPSPLDERNEFIEEMSHHSIRT